MPSNWLTFDSGFPSFTGEESPQQQIRALHNYLFQLREGLQSTLQNLTAKNFKTAALENLTTAQKDEVTKQLTQVHDLLSKLTGQVEALSGRVAETEQLSGRVTEAEGTLAALEGWAAQEEQKVQELGTRVQEAENQVQGLREKVGTAEEKTAALAAGLQALEGEITELKETAGKLASLQETVTGPGGLLERLTAAEEAQAKTAQVLAVGDGGSATLGGPGQRVELIGEIYINGIPYTGGETT